MPLTQERTFDSPACPHRAVRPRMLRHRRLALARKHHLPASTLCITRPEPAALMSPACLQQDSISQRSIAAHSMAKQRLGWTAGTCSGLRIQRPSRQAAMHTRAPGSTAGWLVVTQPSCARPYQQGLQREVRSRIQRRNSKQRRNTLKLQSRHARQPVFAKLCQSCCASKVT